VYFYNQEYNRDENRNIERDSFLEKKKKKKELPLYLFWKNIKKSKIKK